ncbi:hypothetical protein IW261DRAFT_1563602 [Armillaria novae-zelandiae]|uniref:Uncharacterized protein n=1 Tax=Armillaria novae-zelandiae TaxID=153914 RepID=A0AA39PAZ4_9AGAR|nr:hypothetical protein IW261DRAFT_1563602 [Armillaria novae-zelandiae]
MAYSPAAAPADLAEPDDEALRVMLPAIQEEQLCDHYATLPGLGAVCTMVLIGQDETSFDQPPYITIDDMARLYNRDTIQFITVCFSSFSPLTVPSPRARSLVAARHFTSAVPYCNMATLPRSAFTSDGRKPLYNNRTAVAVVTGVVIESALACTCQVSYGKSVHSLRILPFSQPWHRESTMLGLLFEETTVRSENISTAGICLASHALSSMPQHNNNRLPVFDGRASRGTQFLFHDEEFAMLPALPRFPCAELDHFTMVAVGYSPSMWSPSPSNPHVSLNIHFAIMLGHAPSAAALTSAGYGDY